MFTGLVFVHFTLSHAFQDGVINFEFPLLVTLCFCHFNFLSLKEMKITSL